MSKTSRSNYLLSIESAIAGGSLALYDKERMISSKFGAKAVSRAEDLLPSVDSLIKGAKISKQDLKGIAVSLGPGSYTGLRIGIATAMGLSRGLDIPYHGVELFQALSECFFDDDSIFVVPMGKNDLCYAHNSEHGSLRVGSIDDLQSEITRSGSVVLRCHAAVFSMLRSRFGGRYSVIDIGTNLAEYIGRVAFTREPSEKLNPIYVQNPRFVSAL